MRVALPDDVLALIARHADPASVATLRRVVRGLEWPLAAVGVAARARLEDARLATRAVEARCAVAQCGVRVVEHVAFVHGARERAREVKALCYCERHAHHQVQWADVEFCVFHRPSD